MLWPELPAHWEININHYTIIWKYVLRKNKYNWERSAGLGWVVAAYSPLFVQIFTTAVSQLLCNGQNFPLIGKLT
jgi:hypothetical protein